MVKKQSKQSRRWEVEGTVSLYLGILVVLASWPMMHVFYAFFDKIESAAREGQLTLNLDQYYEALFFTGLWVIFGAFLIGYGIYCYKQMK